MSARDSKAEPCIQGLHEQMAQEGPEDAGDVYRYKIKLGVPFRLLLSLSFTASCH